MSEYEKLLRNYVKIAEVCENITQPHIKEQLKSFLDTYFESVICEYSINNKMSLEEIIAPQITTGFYVYRRNDFKGLLEEFNYCFDRELY